MPEADPTPSEREQAERGRATDVLVRLKCAFTRAGWLTDMEVSSDAGNPRVIFPRGIEIEHAKELTLTLEAGIKARVIHV